MGLFRRRAPPSEMRVRLILGADAPFDDSVALTCSTCKRQTFVPRENLGVASSEYLEILCGTCWVSAHGVPTVPLPLPPPPSPPTPTQDSARPPARPKRPRRVRRLQAKRRKHLRRRIEVAKAVLASLDKSLAPLPDLTAARADIIRRWEAYSAAEESDDRDEFMNDLALIYPTVEDEELAKLAERFRLYKSEGRR